MTSYLGSGAGFRLTGIGVELGGNEVLADIDLDVPPGQKIALIGPSGAGKTTLLRLLNGSVLPSAGTVEVAGRDLGSLQGAELRRMRSQVGFIYQDLRLVPNLRVSQNVLSGQLGRLSFWQSVRMFLRPRAADLAVVHELLERVGTAEKMFERVDKLSGGQAQRVAVARALFQKPRILLADEPVASVDPARAEAVLELLTGICTEQGLTLCVSLHDPDLVRRYFDRIVAVRRGRIFFDVPAADVTETDLVDLYALEVDHGL